MERLAGGNLYLWVTEKKRRIGSSEFARRYALSSLLLTVGPAVHIPSAALVSISRSSFDLRTKYLAWCLG
jgi:hypothetical protein